MDQEAIRQTIIVLNAQTLGWEIPEDLLLDLEGLALAAGRFIQRQKEFHDP